MERPLSGLICFSFYPPEEWIANTMWEPVYAQRTVTLFGKLSQPKEVGLPNKIAKRSQLIEKLKPISQ